MDFPVKRKRGRPPKIPLSESRDPQNPQSGKPLGEEERGKNNPKVYTPCFSTITDVEELRNICRNYKENVRTLGLAIHHLQKAIRTMRIRMIENRRRYVANAHEEIRLKIHGEDMSVIPMANAWYRLAFLDDQIHGKELSWKDKMEAMRLIRTEVEHIGKGKMSPSDAAALKGTPFGKKTTSRRLPDLGIPSKMEINLGGIDEIDESEEAGEAGEPDDPTGAPEQVDQVETGGDVPVGGPEEDLQRLQEGIPETGFEGDDVGIGEEEQV